MTGPRARPQVQILARGAGVGLAGRVAGRGANLLGQIAVARLFGPEAFGLYAIGYSLLRLLEVLAPLGLDRGVVRFAAGGRADDPGRMRGLLVQTGGLAALFGFLGGLVLFLAAPWLERSVFDAPGAATVLRWFAVGLPAACALRVAAAATTAVGRRMEYRIYAEELAQPIANLALICLFYLAGWGLIGTVAAFDLSVILGVLVAVFYLRRLHPEAFAPGVRSVAPGRGLIGFSIAASLAGTFTLATQRIDRLILAGFRPADEVGVYLVASQIVTIFLVIASCFHSILSPMVSHLHSRERRAELGEVYRAATRWTLLIGAPVLLVCFIEPRGVIAVLFGAQYSAARVPLLILAVGQVFYLAGSAAAYLLMMSGHQVAWLRISLPALLLNVGLDLLWIPRWGMAGAAAATALTSAGLFTVGIVVAGRLLDLWPFDRGLLKVGAVVAVTAGSLLALRQLLPAGTPLAALVLGAGGAAVALATVLALGLEAEDRAVLDAVVERLRRPAANS